MREPGGTALDAASEVPLLAERDDPRVPHALDLLAEELRGHRARHPLGEIVQVQLHLRRARLRHREP